MTAFLNCTHSNVLINYSLQILEITFHISLLYGLRRSLLFGGRWNALIIDYNKKSAREMGKESQEAEYLSDMAYLLRLLKRVANTLDGILSSAEFNSDSSALIFKVTEQSKILLDITRRQKGMTYQASSKDLTVQRARMRIKEWLCQNKSKYGGGSHFRDLRAFLQQIQIANGVYQKNQDFSHFSSKVYSIIWDELRAIKIKYDLFHLKNPTNSQPLQPRVCKTKSLVLNSCSPLGDIGSLNHLSGLDIDYLALKAACSFCRRSQAEFEQGQLERNRNTSKAIEGYIREYYHYMQRARIRRKYNSELYARQTKRSTKTFRFKTNITEKIYHNFQKQVKHGSSKQNRQQTLGSKILYKLNSVYVSGNQFDVYSIGSSTSGGQFPQSRLKKKPTIFAKPTIRDPLCTRLNYSNTSCEYIN